eukprot:GILI01014109.1.p1 GENE.GILI01014109.1~~GILI01014109.1.p1  ORF type:complete len:226 (+),score=43.93 GILI01014109.1:50-727(+)
MLKSTINFASFHDYTSITQITVDRDTTTFSALKVAYLLERSTASDSPFRVFKRLLLPQPDKSSENAFPYLDITDSPDTTIIGDMNIVDETLLLVEGPDATAADCGVGQALSLICAACYINRIQQAAAVADLHQKLAELSDVVKGQAVLIESQAATVSSNSYTTSWLIGRISKLEEQLREEEDNQSNDEQYEDEQYEEQYENPTRNYKCWGCGEYGHKKNECPQRW